MMSGMHPSVLIIDDEVKKQLLETTVLELNGIKVTVKLPQDVTEEDLHNADVIAIDQFYEWELLPHPSEIAYWPCDGLGLAAVVSRHLNRIGSHAAVVLRTGDLDQLAKNLPHAARIPLLAAQNGSLDWVLEKSDPNPVLKLRQLAEATAALRPFNQGKPVWNEGADWLALPNASWAEGALSEVQVCRPPEHVVASYTYGSAWLRWFAHRVLPFPSFLISDLRAATVLRIPLQHFKEIISDPNSELGRRIIACQYTGHLSGLTSRRWWRAGIDGLIDDLLLEAPEQLTVADTLAYQYAHVHGENIPLLPHDQVVVTVDVDYAEEGIAEMGDCVRLAPDLWPVFADEPWALCDEVEQDDSLFRMVSRGDRARLNPLT